MLQTPDDLQNQYKDQIELLLGLVNLYDSGQTVFAKLLATSIRVLVHDTGRSQSLLGLLGLKTGKFMSTLMSPLPPHQDGTSSSALFGVVPQGSGGKFIPYLDTSPFGGMTPLDFDTYWNEIVLEDLGGNGFTRCQLVLAVANKDGGAHVDPNLDSKYVDLSRNNSLGWKVGETIDVGEVSGAELAAIRQIAHEILKSLVPGYEAHMKMQGMFMMSGFGVRFF